MITQFTVGFSRTVNLGNFESARGEASVTTVVPEGADDAYLADASIVAQNRLLRLLQETFQRQHEDREAAGFYKKMKNV